jgi:hypothetical protein
VDDCIAECIKLAEAALHQPDPVSSTRNHPKTPHHSPVATGDIFSGINRVDQGIIECINLAETTLQCINPREPKAFDCDFDDFISKLKTRRPSPIRFEAVLPKTISALEEDFDHLLQLGEEEATGRWGTTVYDNHSDSATHATPIIGSRQSLARGSTRSSRLEHWKGRKPSKFLNQAHHDPLSTLVNSRSKKADLSLLPTTKKVGLRVPNASHQIVTYS